MCQQKIQKICEFCGTTGGKMITTYGGITYCQRHYKQQYRGGIRKTRNDPNEIILHPDYAEIRLCDENGNYIDSAKVSLHRVPEVRGYRWYLNDDDPTNRYVVSTPGSKKIYLHKLLLSAPEGYEVDHRNQDKLDCRDSNLRVATPTNNRHNRKERADNPSGFRGVRKTQSGKWSATIKCDHVKYYLGLFKTKEEAIEARIDKEIELYGEFSPEYNANEEVRFSNTGTEN